MKRPWKLSHFLIFAIILLAGFVWFNSPKTAYAANPTTMSFQGKVVNANGTNVTDGTYSFLFKLYTVASAGTAIWTETQATVTVAGGVFQVNLGSVCPFFTANACNGSTPIDFNANPALYLGITFNGDVAGEMTPRVQLQSVPFAYQADNASKLGGIAASSYVQLSPGSQQTGNINISGTTTSATGVVTPALTSSGALSIKSGGATTVTIDSGSAGTAAVDIGTTTATSVGIGRTGQTTTVNGALAVNQNATFNSNVIMTFAGTENLAVTSDLAGTVNGISFIGTPSATAGTTNGAFIQQANSANTNGLDNGLTIDNADTNLAIGNGLQITNTGGGGYTNYISTPGFTVTGTNDLRGDGWDYFDPSAMTGAGTLVGTGGTSAGIGGVFSAGAFIGNSDMYAQEFVASLASATTNNRNVGDSTNWYFNNNAQTSVSSSDISTTGGYFRIATGTTTARGGLVTQGATPGVVDKPLNASNLPIVQEKVRPSVVRITDDFVWGMMDTATAQTANDSLPTNGFIFATNNSTGATGWTGMVRSGGATIGTSVTCPGGIGTNFATGRIVVVNATTVRFFIDVDAGNGVNLVDCGTVTGALPTADLALGMSVAQTTTTNANFDMDYAHFWQDDAPAASPTQAAENAVAQQLQADLTTDNVETANDALSLDSTIATGEVSGTPTQDPAANTPSSNDNQPQLGADGTSQLINNHNTNISINGDDLTFSGSLNVNSANLSGGLGVGGDANFAGLSTFQKLATFLGKTIFRQDVEFDAHVTVAKDSAGFALLHIGESSVHIKFAQAYDNPPIISLTLSNGQFVLASVGNVTNEGFDITLEKPAEATTTLNWTALGATDPQTATNISNQ